MPTPKKSSSSKPKPSAPKKNPFAVPTPQRKAKDGDSTAGTRRPKDSVTRHPATGLIYTELKPNQVRNARKDFDGFQNWIIESEPNKSKAKKAIAEGYLAAGKAKDYKSAQAYANKIFGSKKK